MKFKMKKITLLLFFIISIAVAGQAPQWINDKTRENNYPVHTYFKGFATGNLRQGETVDAAKKRLLKDAQGLLAEDIRVTIKSETSHQSLSTKVNGSERVEATFQSDVQTAASAEIAGIHSEPPYHDAASGLIYAFVYVKRADLAAFYRNQINIDLNKAEIAVGVAEQLKEAGKKMSAHRKIQEAKQTLDEIDFYRYLLIAADANVNESGLQSQRGNQLTQTVERLNITLEQSTFVYMDCRYEKRSPKDDAFSSDPGILCDIIAQALVDNECSITENKEEADYELTLITSTTQRSDGKTGQYPILTYFANAKGTLYNRATNKTTANFTILNDADCYYEGRDAEEAATNAFKLPELKDKVMEKILPKIKN
jgi:hypothetical protein